MIHDGHQIYVFARIYTNRTLNEKIILSEGRRTMLNEWNGGGSEERWEKFIKEDDQMIYSEWVCVCISMLETYK